MHISTSVSTLASTLLGGIIGFASAYFATNRTIGAQQTLQRSLFERNDKATRNIVGALLRDVYQYVSATARLAQFDPVKWESPVARLLDYITRIEVGQALTAAQLDAVLRSAFEADLALTRLKQEVADRDLPFQSDFPTKHPEVGLEQAEIFFVVRMRILARDAFVAFNLR